MKKLGILFVAIMMISTFAVAQKGKPKREAQTPEQRASRQTEQLAKQLELSEEQQAKVKQITIDRIVKMDKIKEKYQGAKSTERDVEVKEVREIYRQQLKSILTPIQFENWHKMRKEYAKKAKENQAKSAKPVDAEETDDIF